MWSNHEWHAKPSFQLFICYWGFESTSMLQVGQMVHPFTFHIIQRSSLEKGTNRGLRTSLSLKLLEKLSLFQTRYCALCFLQLLAFLSSLLHLYIHGTKEEDGASYHPGSNAILTGMPRHTWSGHPVMRDYLWVRALHAPVKASSTFDYQSSDSSDSEMPLDQQTFWTLFHDNDDGEGSVFPPRSVLWMMIEREEFPFYGIRFESKMQRTNSSTNRLDEYWLYQG